MSDPAEKHHFLRHTGVYLLARGLPGVIAFLAIPLFTRLLDPAGYGKYALVLATASLFSALLSQGIALALVRLVPAWEQQPERLKSTVLTLALLVIAATGAGAAVAVIVPPLRPWRSMIAAGWLVLAMQQLFDLFNEYARARLRPAQVMWLQLAKATFTVVIGAALIAAGAGWWGALVGAALAMAAANACAFLRDWAATPLGIDRQVLPIVLRYGAPLSLTVALAGVIFSCDRFLIAWFLGDGAAGLYSASVDLTTRTLTLLLMVISSAMFPLAVRALESAGPDAAREQMRVNASLLMAVGLPAVAALAVLSGTVADCFLGGRFRTAGSSIMPLVALGSFLAGFKAYYWDAAFQFVHKTICQVWIVLIVAGVNVGLNLLAIPRFGINGSAAASVLAYAASIAITIWFGRRQFPLPFPLRPFLQICLATAAMAAGLLAFRHHQGAPALVALVAGGCLVYGTALLAFNFMGARDALFSRLTAAKAGGAEQANPQLEAVLVEPHG
jgi:O-antigen/teichoic acid export membrane protein